MFRTTNLFVAVILAAVLGSPVAAVAGPAREEVPADAPAVTSLLARWLEPLAALFAGGPLEKVLARPSGDEETDAGPNNYPDGFSGDGEEDGGSQHAPDGASGNGEQDGGSHNDPNG